MFKLKITWTNLIGAIVAISGVFLKYDYAVTAGVILILGKQVEPILLAWKGQTK